MARTYLFTSESVSEGHPDKIADQISDAVLDAYFDRDPYARVACEALVKTGMALIAGEITSTALIDLEAVVRETIREIGYTDPEYGFEADTCAVLVALGKQSPDIARGVIQEEEIGAGDQGMMFGFACRETEVLMPAPIHYAHRLVKRQAEVRRSGKLPWLRPDAKSQVTLRYEDERPVAVDTVVLSTQHDPEVSYEEIREGVIEEIIRPVLPKEWFHRGTKIFVNPTGRFVIGGPVGDCGLTGRKIIVDTYGGRAHHGGGAFSGKDPTKVDRSAAYMMRYVAKNIVAAGLAERVELQVSYAIGVPEPTAIHIETFGTARIPEERLERIVRELFDFRPRAIIEKLDLRRPIYRKTAAYGHFGREEPEFTWERTDMVEALRDAAGLKETVSA